MEIDYFQLRKRGKTTMRKRYSIEENKELNNTVLFPSELESLTSKIEKIAFGNRTCTAKFKHHNKNSVVFSPDIKETLLFPDITNQVHLFYENNTLYVGPLVGIITTGFTPSTLRPFGDRSVFFERLLSLQESVGVIPYIFGPQHINWDTEEIEAFFYHKKSWQKQLIPFPNVIYDRVPNRRSENRNELKNVKKRMQQEYFIPWYNPGFFNKLDVHEKLYNDYKAYRYLPETVPFTSFSHIEALLADYGHVYLKPANGSLGIGIHQILYDKMEGHYFCRYIDDNGVKRLQKFTTLENLVNHVFRNKSLSNMLVQQGISLIKVNQRPVDFRVHTNKDENGVWQISAMAAKIAGSGSVTTHVKNGGIIKSLDEIFSLEELNTYTSKLKEAALQLSYSLEKQMDGIIGEIGFDLGIDNKGNVWLFEANSKPGRSIFTHPKLKEFDLLTRKLSLAFTIYLTEKSIQSPEEIFK
jgi:hypothetical protein